MAFVPPGSTEVLLLPARKPSAMQQTSTLTAVLQILSKFAGQELLPWRKQSKTLVSTTGFPVRPEMPRHQESMDEF